ncbi:hypothetical protein Tco_0474137 [Tanacetum coccineum]
MDDPHMTMEEYIKLEEAKARSRGWVFNWKTATNGKIRIDDDLHDLSSVEAEFSAINRGNSYLRDILGDILGKDMHYPFTRFVKPSRVSLVYKRNPAA